MSEESALKLALKAKAVRAQSGNVFASDPIAIVGMACRVPGADGVEAFWNLLSEGIDAVRPIPRDRWDADELYDPDPAAPGKSLVREAGVLDRIDGFDADYFEILPREADQMDPQQRLFLEVAIEALEDAGLPQPQLAGSRAAAFVASYHNDYPGMLYADREAIDLRTLTGTLHSVLVNRLSYFLNLKGPSVSVDTACSASLVAVHLACQSLRMGESDVALAGGVSLIVSPELMISMSKVGFMAPDGRCKTFDASADGFGRGEGCGAIVLKRLSDALADGDRVLAVIRGSAVNQDGRSTILTAPSGPAQEALIREALASARVDPARIGLVEAHGTGTALGDPIEVEAIAAVLGHAGLAPCMLGSVKANIGHLEAAAGIVGMIKAVLSLRHEAIPRQVHFRKLSPHIHLAGTRLSVPTQLMPWPAGETLRAAGVSSFGVGGTNAHVILEEAPRLPEPEPADGTAWRLLPLSAKSGAALAATEEAWLGFAASTEAGIADLAASAALRRTHHPVRRSLVVRSKADIVTALGEAVAEPAQSASGPARIGFVFSGQGPQWHAMGRQLMADEPVFRDVIEACDSLLKPLSGWSLIEALAASKDDTRVGETEVAQPALFAVQVALAALLESWGIKPDSVVGHSIGELAALHVAGVLDLPEAIRIVWHRGHLMQRATGMGSMASVDLDEREAAALLAAHPGLDVAAINAPRSLVLSGDGAAMERALSALQARGVANRPLPVRYAFHSAQMQPLAAELGGVLGTVAAQPPRIRLFSTVTGAPAETGFDAGYFARNVRQPVRFAQAIGAMAADGCDIFVEIGPHPVLRAAIEDTLGAASLQARVLGTLRRGRDEREMLLRTVGSLYEAGVDPDWSQVDSGDGLPVALPAYPWQRRRHWIRQRPSAPAQTGPLLHPVLGRRVPVALPDTVIYEGTAADITDWSGDHRIFGKALLPAAGVAGAFAAAATLALGVNAAMRDFVFSRPIVVTEDTRWQTIVRTLGDETGIELFSADGQQGPWHSAATAVATKGLDGWPVLSGITAADERSAEKAYEAFESMGVGFGPAFRLLDRVRAGEGVAEASVLPLADTSGLPHPAQIDAAIQLCSVAAGADAAPTEIFLPVGADRIVVRPLSAGGSLDARVRVTRQGDTLTADLAVVDAGGETVVNITGLRFVRATGEALGGDGDIYDVVWEPATETALQQAGGDWLLLEDAGGVARAVAARLADGGATCRFVRPAQAFAQVDSVTWTVDPADPANFERLLASLPSGTRNVGHFWSLDGITADSDAADMLGVASALHVIKAAVKRGGTLVRLVTRGGQAVLDHESPVVLNPAAAPLWGLFSSAAAEHPEIGLRLIDADPFAGTSDALADELAAGAASRVALRDGVRLVPRLTKHRPVGVAVSGTLVRVALASPGSFDDLVLEPLNSSALGAREVRIKVLAAGINFRDVLVTLGMYPGKLPPLGVECAGVVVECGAEAKRFHPGQRVFGYAPGSLATETVAREDFLAEIPAGMPAHIAAGIPIAYLTAHHGLHGLAGLRAGERVLIHAGAGGVGLAAVHLALRAGAEVFATAGSLAKRTYLSELGVAHVLDSRSVGFVDAIRAATGGRGVDVVLNSLAGPFVEASFAVLARGGRFLELGKREVWSPERVASERPDAAYHLYDLGSEAEAGTVSLAPIFAALAAGLSDGSLQPLPVTAYPMYGVGDAMRLIAQARHVGKVVLKIANEETQPFRVSQTGTVLVTGGLGGLGLETARWLADRGARYLALAGRSAPDTQAQAAIETLRSRGVTVRVVQADVGDLGSLKAGLDLVAETMPPLTGVVHAAGAVHDGVLIEQRWSEARHVMRGKARGAWLLDRLTRHIPLDFFVLFSAAAVPLGARGQGLYPAANAELDLLAERRRRLGLPGLSVAWGLWRGVGMAAGSGGRKWEERGLRGIDPRQGFAALERLLAEDVAYAVVAPVDWGRFLANLPEGLDRSFFAGLAPAPIASGTVVRKSAASSPVEMLKAALPARRRALLLDYLRGQALHVLGLDPSTRIAHGQPLRDAGVDSLMSMELRNLLARAGGVALPATLLFDHPTIEALATFLTVAWKLEDAPEAAAPAALVPSIDELGESMSDEEAERLLLSELAELNGGDP